MAVIACCHFNHQNGLATADLIVVLRAGRIVESGQHKELLERRGLYFQLFRHQLSSAA